MRTVFHGLHARGLPRAVTCSAVEFTSNILMFVPFGVFWFILASRIWCWAAAVAGMGLSIMIELTQSALLTHRVATPYDVLANTVDALVGAFVGAVVWSALVWIRGRRGTR